MKEEGEKDIVLVVSSEELELNWPLNSGMKFMKQALEPTVSMACESVFLHSVTILHITDLINTMLDKNLLFFSICSLLFPLLFSAAELT